MQLEHEKSREPQRKRGLHDSTITAADSGPITRSTQQHVAQLNLQQQCCVRAMKTRLQNTPQQSGTRAYDAAL